MAIRPGVAPLHPPSRVEAARTDNKILITAQSEVVGDSFTEPVRGQINKCGSKLQTEFR